MLYEHLCLVYEHGGLGALIRQGADSDQICMILRDARVMAGITPAEEDIAYEAVKNSELSRHGRIVRLCHEKYQSALDYCLFTLRSNLVFTPTGVYYRGNDDEVDILKAHFHCVREHDEIWRIEGDFDEIYQAFLALTG